MLRTWKRYRIDGIRPDQYRTTTHSGERPATVIGAFRGIWRDHEGIYALFALESGGNMAIPLHSVDRYQITEDETGAPVQSADIQQQLTRVITLPEEACKSLQ